MSAADELNVTCPAGELIAETPQGPACRCKIESSTIGARDNATSLVEFCMGDHTKCPTWRAEKNRLAEHRRSLMDETRRLSEAAA